MRILSAGDRVRVNRALVRFSSPRAPSVVQFASVVQLQVWYNALELRNWPLELIEWLVANSHFMSQGRVARRRH